VVSNSASEQAQTGMTTHRARPWLWSYIAEVIHRLDRLKSADATQLKHMRGSVSSNNTRCHNPFDIPHPLKLTRLTEQTLLKQSLKTRQILSENNAAVHTTSLVSPINGLQFQQHQIWLDRMLADFSAEQAFLVRQVHRPQIINKYSDRHLHTECLAKRSDQRPA